MSYPPEPLDIRRPKIRSVDTISAEDDLVEHGSGMVRSNPHGKPDYTLIDMDLLERWAQHMTAHATEKGHNNWRKAHSVDDELRFKQSAWRHFLAVMRGDTDEDHAAALVFNIAGLEYVRRQLR